MRGTCVSSSMPDTKLLSTTPTGCWILLEPLPCGYVVLSASCGSASCSLHGRRATEQARHRIVRCSAASTGSSGADRRGWWVKSRRMGRGRILRSSQVARGQREPLFAAQEGRATLLCGHTCVGATRVLASRPESHSSSFRATLSASLRWWEGLAGVEGWWRERLLSGRDWQTTSSQNWRLAERHTDVRFELAEMVVNGWSHIDPGANDPRMTLCAALCRRVSPWMGRASTCAPISWSSRHGHVSSCARVASWRAEIACEIGLRRERMCQESRVDASHSHCSGLPSPALWRITRYHAVMLLKPMAALACERLCTMMV